MASTKETLDKLKAKANELYGRQGLYDRRLIFIDTAPKTLRHEDPKLKGSGTWMDVSMFIPDDEER